MEKRGLTELLIEQLKNGERYLDFFSGDAVKYVSGNFKMRFIKVGKGVVSESLEVKFHRDKVEQIAEIVRTVMPESPKIRRQIIDALPPAVKEFFREEREQLAEAA